MRRATAANCVPFEMTEAGLRTRHAWLGLLAAACIAALAVASASGPAFSAPLPREKPASLIAADALSRLEERRVTTTRILPSTDIGDLVSSGGVSSGGERPVAEAERSRFAAAPLPQPAPRERAEIAAEIAAGAAPALQETAAAVPANVSRSAVAKDLFGAMRSPAPLAARSIGSYAKGCVAGATALAVDGPSWQVMRLSRNRNWGHPELIDMLQRLATDAPALGWNGLLVGDLAQPRGGPMTSGHASHQIGLDADIWLTPMPDRTLSRDERESMSAVSMLKGPSNLKDADRGVDPAKWSDARARLIRRAAQDRRVARIFAHPGIKQALCRFETGDRSWLRKVRPWWGHHYHFHVRIACPDGSIGCKDQNPPPAGDGCGKELAWWLSDEPWVPKKPAKPSKPSKKKHMTLAALPDACTQVLVAR
ncbi:penicillin-insensitive murein endopeptidase [Stappia sp.]|uniref:penicillin-insensitive murein endopeptidase n=1 Tax=Stappia sp. TaxID=1870903 RepID=UPI003D0BF6FA